MKVLWFEVTTPSRYKLTNNVICGWQDSLEDIVRSNKNIELSIAFVSKSDSEKKIIDGVAYYPLLVTYSILEKFRTKFTWSVDEMKTIKSALSVIGECKPDIIHVFGCEWTFGLIAQYTDIPVVIHIQGAVVSMYNVLYPPTYNLMTFVRAIGFNLPLMYRFIKQDIKIKTRRDMEHRIWKAVGHYMGRTSWDRALVNTLHPGASYHLVNEALRPVFYQTQKRWDGINNKKIILFSTGVASIRKGPNVILKTAHVLRQMNVDFEWQIAGSLPPFIKNAIEYKENLCFEENNITILGNVSAQNLIDKLCRSSVYIHASYIENSPNSICEAQILGVPVISAMVGGIDSIVHNDEDGKLIPVDDPWRLANEIVDLVHDKDRMKRYSDASMKLAHQRHSPKNIQLSLFDCYSSIVGCKS